MLKFISKKICVTAVIVLVVLALVAVGVTSTIPDSSKNEISQPTVNISDEKTNYNFLVLGVDRSERLTDVIMLASFDIATSRVAIVQIPRDTYAEYTESAYRKLNGAMSFLNGEREMADFFENVFQITIDHYVTVDLEVMSEAVDLLGGVEVNVPEDMVYEDIYQDLKIELKAGKQLLDGNKVKQFIRYREGYVRGDIARLDAQKIFLSALLEKLTSCSLSQLIATAQKMLSCSKSDVSIGECVKFVSNATKIQRSNMVMFTMPGADIQSAGGSWYYILNKKETHKMLREYFGCDVELSEFDEERKLTGAYSIEFNRIYDATEGYECQVHTAESIGSSGIEIDRIK